MGQNQTQSVTDDEPRGANGILLIGVYFLYALVLPLFLASFVVRRFVRHLRYDLGIVSTIRTLLSLVWYLKFLGPAPRRRVFVRAAIPTPAQYFDSIPGEKVINGDPSVERQDPGEAWDVLRREIYRRDDYTCQICGVQGGSDGKDVVLQADHVVPVSRGGEDDPENLRTLCRTCHQARHARLF